MKKLLSIATITLTVLAYSMAVQAQSSTPPAKKGATAQNSKSKMHSGCTRGAQKMAGTAC
jgi:hypothetical protein